MRKKLFGKLISSGLAAALAFTSVIPSYAMEGLDEAAQGTSEEVTLETEEPSDETPVDPPAEPAAETPVDPPTEPADETPVNPPAEPADETPEETKEDEKDSAGLEDESEGEDGEEEEITIEPEVEEEKNDLVGKPKAPTLTLGQVTPTADTATGNGSIAAAWKAASGQDASGNMVADTNDYHIGVWYATLTDLDPTNTYYLVREYLDNSGNVLAADWGSYNDVTEKFVFSSWGMNLQDASWHQIELKDAVEEIDTDVAKVRFTLTVSEPSGSGELNAKQDLNWPNKISAGEAISGLYAYISNIDDLIIAGQDTVTRSGSTVNYTKAYGSITLGQVEPTSNAVIGNEVIAAAWKAASGNEASGNMIDLRNDYHIGAWYAALTGLESEKTYYLVREYLDNSGKVLAADWGTYEDPGEKFVFSSWGMNLQDTSYHQRELKDTVTEISEDVAKVRFTLTTSEPQGYGSLTTKMALGWPSKAAGAALDGKYASISNYDSLDIISQDTVVRSGVTVGYQTGTLAVGQVEPTADTTTGNDTIAAAWKAASGKDAEGNMVDTRNDYHIGAWYASLTGLESEKTYYLVREYLDDEDNVLAADWGSYNGVTEKFVFSSWGMNLQDTSYRQRELKDTISEISDDVEKVRYTLTASVPQGSGSLTTKMALGWPSKEIGDDLDSEKAYKSVSFADYICQETIARNGNSVNYVAGTLAVGQVEPTADTTIGNGIIAAAWKAASGKDAEGNMVADTNDYHIGAWYASLTGLDSKQTYYLIREYLDSYDSVLAVDWGKYEKPTEKFVFSSWGMNLQDTSWHQIELKDAVAGINADVAMVRFTLTTTEPTPSGTLKAAQALNWPATIAAGDDITGNYAKSIGAIADVDILDQKTIERYSALPIGYASGTLAVGQVKPTAETDEGNAEIATAWKRASGQEATDSMKSETNDYHIGVWHASLTNLDNTKTYYLVREYLDDSYNVLAADWGKYENRTERFVFSSWGMNLQDTSYRQRELKNTVSEISADVAMVRFTLTTSVPQGTGDLTTRIKLGWPSMAAGVSLAEEKTYKSVRYADYISQDIIVRSGDAVPYDGMHTVDFDYNDGEEFNPYGMTQYVFEGEKVVRPKVPERLGYIFGGWFKEKDCSNEFDFDKPIDSNTTIYAKWTAITYKVKFYSNGGTGTMADQTFTYDQAAALRKNTFTKKILGTEDAYSFVGWSKTEGGALEFWDEQEIFNITDLDGDEIDLYAVWMTPPTEKPVWTAVWTWPREALDDYSYAILTLTDVREPDVNIQCRAESEMRVDGDRVAYYVEYTYNGVKYTSSRTFLTVNGENVELGKNAFGYVGVKDYTYTGKAIKQDDLKVYWDESILVEGTDYTLKYKNNVNAGTATVTIIGKGQFDKAFNEEVAFTILKADIEDDAEFSAADVTIFKDAKATCKLLRGKTTINSKLYTVTYSDPDVVNGQKVTKLGDFTGTITPVATSNFTGERQFTLRVIDKQSAIPASKLSVKFDKLAVITEDETIYGYIPKFTVSSGSDKIRDDEDPAKAIKNKAGQSFDEAFDVEYFDNFNAGTATVIITAKEGCKMNGKDVVGSIKKTFNIPGKKFDKDQKAAFNVIKNKTVPYTGKAYDLWEVLDVVLGDQADTYAPGLEYGIDYEVSAYAKNIKKGTMTITIIGRGIYKDTVKVPVKIAGYSAYEVSFDGFCGDVTDGENNRVLYRVGGTTVTGLVVRALDGGFFLREGVDYTVSYKNNKLLGSDPKNRGKVAKLVIKGKGNYGTLEIPFTIVSNQIDESSVYVVPTEIASNKVDATLKNIGKNKVKPTVIDKVTGKKLTAGKDFTFNYEIGEDEFDKTTDSVIWVEIFGMNPPEVAGTVSFEGGSVYSVGIRIAAPKLVGSGKKANIAIKDPKNGYFYTGKAITLDADDFVETEGFAKYGEDFEIVGYKNNIKAGTAKVTIRAIEGGRYGGTVTLSFKINKAKKIKN